MEVNKIQRPSKDYLNSVLRKGKATELVLGGVWYYKDEKGDFKRVVNENITDGFRRFCSTCSELGFMYLFRANPNCSYTEELHNDDLKRIKSYQQK